MKIKTWIAASGLAVCLLVQPAAAGQYEHAQTAYNNGDYAKAIQLFQPLAEQGNTDAQSYIGIMYLIGDGVPQNYAEALKWLRPAAERGDAFAQSNLGHMYLTGLGVPLDYAEALKLLRPAAERGDDLAQAGLGSMYEKGQGVAQDYVQAHMWFDLAAAQIPASDTANRDTTNSNRVAKQMTPDQIAEAQRLAREWLVAHRKNL